MGARELVDGPVIELKASCFSCEHCRGRRYDVQGDSGTTVSCEHPSVGEKHIADSHWGTPDWCPLKKKAERAFCEALIAALDKPVTP